MRLFAKGGIILLLAVGTSTILPAQNAKEDVQSGRSPKDRAKDAGKTSKKAAKNTGHKVKKESKKAANKAAGKSKEGADRVQQKTEPK